MKPAELRPAMAAGIAFVVFFVVGIFTSFGHSPDIKSSDSDAVAAGKYVTKLSDSGARTGILVGAYLLVIAAILFVWFSRGLGELFESPFTGRIVGGLGVLGAAAIAAGAMAIAVVAGMVSFGGEPVPKDGDTIRVPMGMAFPFLFVVLGLVSAAIAATVALRATALPTWLRYAGALAVLGGIFAVIFLPMGVVMLWFLAVAIFGLARPVAAR
jgi:hypothetical protein